MEFSQKMYDLEAVIEDLRNILIHGLTPSITVPIVNTLQERPRLQSAQIKLSNIKRDLSN